MRKSTGGPGRRVRALERAAARHGVEIMTGAEVVQVVVDERTRGRRHSWPLAIQFESRAVVSSVDPKRTFGSLCEPEHLPPEFLWRIKHLRARGVLAKVNLALSALPVVPGTTKEMLASPLRIAPSLDYLEQAFDHVKYGEWSREPWIEFTLPSVRDPSLAPTGAHVLSAYVQWVPNDDWEPGVGDRDAAVELASVERVEAARDARARRQAARREGCYEPSSTHWIDTRRG